MFCNLTTQYKYGNSNLPIYFFTALNPPNFWEQFSDNIYCILKRTHLEKIFYYIKNGHQNIKFTIEELSNGELTFLDTLLKRNNGNICIVMQETNANFRVKCF